MGIHSPSQLYSTGTPVCVFFLLAVCLQRKVKKTPGVPPSVPVREKKNQPSAVPPTVPAVSSTSDDLPKTSPASQSKTESSNNASGLLPTPIVPDSVSGQSRVAPPFRHRTERVSVVDRITG